MRDVKARDQATTRRSWWSDVTTSTGSLLAFCGPINAYPAVSAQSLSDSSWADVGNSLRKAMGTIDKKVGTAAIR